MGLLLLLLAMHRNNRPLGFWQLPSFVFFISSQQGFGSGSVWILIMRGLLDPNQQHAIPDTGGKKNIISLANLLEVRFKKRFFLNFLSSLTRIRIQMELNLDPNPQ